MKNCKFNWSYTDDQGVNRVLQINLADMKAKIVEMATLETQIEWGLKPENVGELMTAVNGILKGAVE